MALWRLDGHHDANGIRSDPLERSEGFQESKGKLTYAENEGGEFGAGGE